MDQAPLLNEGDVVSVTGAVSGGPFVASKTFKVVDFVQSMKIQTRVPPDWLEGIACELLKADAPGWKKGKLRVFVELQFIPDEPEAPASEVSNLDALRSKLDL
jgi:hypothetical protein